MNDKQAMLVHFLAALAYRTQKAIRDAPPEFASFRASDSSRSAHELIRHMDSVLGYARTFFIGGSYSPPDLPDFQASILHFHEVIIDLARLIEEGAKLKEIAYENLLQGPFSDAMTHTGQLAMMRRLAGKPVKSENFIYAKISADNLGPNQPPPACPDDD